MEIPIIVKDRCHSSETVSKWRSVWSSICEMCYNRQNIQEEIITTPGPLSIDDETVYGATEEEHSYFYSFYRCKNDEQITLDYTWKHYDQKRPIPMVVPELKKLHVPAHLFYTLGVKSWFAECFPNCKVTFWKL